MREACRRPSQLLDLVDNKEPSRFKDIKVEIGTKLRNLVRNSSYRVNNYCLGSEGALQLQKNRLSNHEVGVSSRYNPIPSVIAAIIHVKLIII